MLDRFSISARKATPGERLEPFERYRRGVMKWLSRRKPFEKRRYLEQEGRDFDERLLAFRIKGTLYIDGYWQSETYFKDVEKIIREDLRIITPTNGLNHRMAEEIRRRNAVAVHVRWFHTTGSTMIHNLSDDYYRRAIAFMESKIDSCHYFLFSDDPETARPKIALPEGRVTCVSHNQRDENAYADLWLMTLCRHFITANSSWWGAWLGGDKEKVVIAPALEIREGLTSWNFSGQIPSAWIQI